MRLGIFCGDIGCSGYPGVSWGNGEYNDDNTNWIQKSQ